MLKNIELDTRAARKFARMRFARGERRTSRSGMMGFATRASTARKHGKQRAKTRSDATTRG